MAKKPTARDVLSTGTGNAPPLRRWMENNPKAVEFVDAWLEMRAKNETTWTLERVLAYLRTQYGCRTRSETGLLRWLRENRADAYSRTVAR